jgi:hypothetical protein
MRMYKPYRLYVSAFAVVLAGCDLLADPVFPVRFEASVEVLESGSGQEWGAEIFPAAAGDHWMFCDADGRCELTWPTEETTTINGRDTAIWFVAGAVATIEGWIRVTDEAVYDFGGPSAFSACSIPRLHFPVVTGKRWRIDCGVNGNLVAEVTVEGLERVRTDVGWFDAVRVRYSVQRPQMPQGDAGEHLWWFAPGVGVVKKQSQSFKPLVLRYGFVGGQPRTGDPDP